jgi:steroid delta-isomerase-like uncharacterized protein
MAAGTSNNEKIVQRSLEAFEEADERALREDLTPDFIVHAVPPGFTEDADGYVKLAQHMKAGLPDLRLDVEDMFAGDDRVAVRFTVRGTHRGELFGVPPSNRNLSMRGIEIYRLSDGKIAEYWGEYDMYDLFGSPPGLSDAAEEG